MTRVEIKPDDESNQDSENLEAFKELSDMVLCDSPIEGGDGEESGGNDGTSDQSE